MFRSQKIRLVAIMLGAILLAIVILELLGATHIVRKKASSSTIPSTGPTNSQNESSTGQEQPKPSTEKQNTPAEPTSSGDTNLTIPYGTFVSNHKPSLSSSASEQSVCMTTPGANCSIKFTSNGITKTLEAKTADSNGAVYWDWDVKTAGLSEGSWEITATATSGAVSKSTTDGLKLEVLP